MTRSKGFGSIPGEVNARLAEELSGAEKLQALLKSRGFTFVSFAPRVLELTGVGCSGDQVKDTIYGRREYPHVRDAIAREWELSRSEVDALLDEKRSTIREAA